MSIFGKIRHAKKAADDHRKSSTVAPVPEPEVKKSYKHVPTHAAQDALSVSSSQVSSSALLAQIKEQRRRVSELGPIQPGGSETFFSKVPANASSLRQRSAGDLSITSVMKLEQQQQFEQFQASQLKQLDPKRNPYRYTGSNSSTRKAQSRNMSNTSLARMKSPLSNTISGNKFQNLSVNNAYHAQKKTYQKIPMEYLLKLQRIPHTQATALHQVRVQKPKSTYISKMNLTKRTLDFLEMKKTVRAEQPHIVPSARKPKQKVDSASPSPKSITFLEPEGSSSSKLPMGTSPSPVLLEDTRPFPSDITRSEQVEVKPVLAPIPQSPVPKESVPSRLNRLTLHINPNEDDWFPDYSFTSSTFAPEPSQDSTAQSVPVSKDGSGPSTGISRPPKEIILPPNHDLIISRNAQPSAVERDNTFVASSSTSPTINSHKPLLVHIKPNQSLPPQPRELEPQQQAIENSWSPTWPQPESAPSSGQDILSFAQQLRRPSRQSSEDMYQLSSPSADHVQMNENERFPPQNEDTSYKQQQHSPQKHFAEEASLQYKQSSSSQQLYNQTQQPYSPPPKMPGRYPMSSNSPRPANARMISAGNVVYPQQLEQNASIEKISAPTETYSLYPQNSGSPVRKQSGQHHKLSRPPQPSLQQTSPTRVRADPRQHEYPPPSVQQFQPQPDYFNLSFQQDPQPSAPEPPKIPLASKPRFTQANVQNASSTEIIRVGTPTMYTIPEGVRQRSESQSTSTPSTLYARTTSPVNYYPPRGNNQMIHAPSSYYGSPYEVWTQGPSPPIEVTHHHVHYNFNDTGFVHEQFDRIASPPLSYASGSQYDRIASPPLSYASGSRFDRIASPPLSVASRSQFDRVASPPLSMASRSQLDRVASPPLSMASRAPSRGGSDFRPPTGRLEDRKLLVQNPSFTTIGEAQDMRMTPSRTAPQPQRLARPMASELHTLPPTATKAVPRKSSRVFSSLWSSKKSRTSTVTAF
jgi:hypothetical protein